MNSDTGFGWVHRWFAKPLASGSIPARVSIYIKALEIPQHKRFKGQFRFFLGRMISLWVLRAPENYPENYRSFRGGILYPIETVNSIKLHTSEEYKKNITDVNRLREVERKYTKLQNELIAAKKQISSLKRQYNSGGVK